MRRPASHLLTFLLVLATVFVSGTAALAHPAPRTATPAARPAKQTVLAHYVRDTGSRLVVVAESRPLATRTRGVARAAITESLRVPRTPGLTTLAPTGTRVLGATVKQGVLTIDLSKEVRRNPGVGAAGEIAFQQQLAHTAAQFPTVSAVRVRVQGRPITELWGHADWSRPIRPDLTQRAR